MTCFTVLGVIAITAGSTFFHQDTLREFAAACQQIIDYYRFKVTKPATMPRSVPYPNTTVDTAPQPEPMPQPSPAPRPREIPWWPEDPDPQPSTEPQPTPQPSTPMPTPPTPTPTEDIEPNWVVRGGEAQNLQAASSYHKADPSLFGFSVQSRPGHTITELAAAGQFRNPSISVSTVEGLVRAAATKGYFIEVVESPGIGLHATVRVPDPFPDDLNDALKSAFTQMPNPARVR